MRLIAVLTGAAVVGIAGVGYADGHEGKCFDKGTLTYVDCPEEEMAVGGPPPRPSFAGFYAGVHAGYGSADFDGRFDTTDGGGDPGLVFEDLEVDGFLGGGQIGYNWQTEDNLVLGVELSGSYFGGEDSITNANSEIGEGDVNWIGEARVRAGVAWHYVMPYATAGVAVAGYEALVADNGGFGGVAIDETAVGGVVGGGFEWMIDPNVTIGAEGLYYFFDDRTDINNIVSDADPGDSISIDGMMAVRGKLNVRF